MFATKIIAEDIFGSKTITINTPVIFLHNVSHEYLLPVCDSIYTIDTRSLHRDLEDRIQFIDRFVPVGQVYLNWKRNPHNWNGKSQVITLPMANTRMIHVTNTYEEIERNVWIGIIRKDDKESRTLGTIRSKGIPKETYPVFPASFMIKNDTYNEDDVSYANYVNVYSDPSYGRWMLNPYKFNVDRTHLKMIDSAGELSNLYLPRPVTPMDVLDVGYGNDDYNRKVYFTAQGVIVSDANCVPPLDNMNKMTYKECNATGSGRISGISFENEIEPKTILANDDDQLALSLNEAADYDDTFSKRSKGKTFSKKKKLVLREKDEPWFADAGIVGTAASVTNPHKITGRIDGEASMPVVDMGVMSNERGETHAPFTTPCAVPEPEPGYSRYQQMLSCDGYPSRTYSDEFVDEYFNNDNNTSLDYVNNYIIYAICIIIILLLVYRRF